MRRELGYDVGFYQRAGLSFTRLKHWHKHSAMLINAAITSSVDTTRHELGVFRRVASWDCHVLTNNEPTATVAMQRRSEIVRIRILAFARHVLRLPERISKQSMN